MSASNRIDDIATKLHTACGVIAQPTREFNEHQEAKNILSAEMNGIGGSRLSVAANIAAMAHAEAWTDAEIAQAVGKAGKMSNNNDSATKTLGVFISEMKQFASPKVRADFPTTLAALQSAWLAEQDMLAGMEAEERKTADAPIKTFKPRIYHLVIECARRIKDGKLVAPTCIEDVVRWARDNDPRNDEERVKKAIAASIAKLEKCWVTSDWLACRTSYSPLTSSSRCRLRICSRHEPRCWSRQRTRQRTRRITAWRENNPRNRRLRRVDS